MEDGNTTGTLPGDTRAGRIRYTDDELRWRMNRRINLVDHLFPWAVEELAKAYGS